MRVLPHQIKYNLGALVIHVILVNANFYIFRLIELTMNKTAALTAHTFVALCFRPQRQTSQEIIVELIPGSLVLCLEDGYRHAVSLETVKVQTGGFGGDQWVFSWQDHDGTWGLTLTDTLVQAKLLAQPPVGLMPQLMLLAQQKKGGVRRARWGWFVLIALLSLLLAGFIAALTQAERLANVAIDRIGIEDEARLGHEVFAAQKNTMRFMHQPALEAAIQEMGNKLTANSKYQYEWYVIDDPSVNAFALPGGIVVINSGLIQSTTSAEELAGVLAHEIQHVERRHGLKSMAKSMGLNASISLLLGEDAKTLGGQLAGDLLTLKFSRESEEEADLKGFFALRDAGINPNGMVQFFTKLQQAGTTTPDWLSTHPAPTTRLVKLQTLIKDLPAKSKFEPLHVNWTKLKASLPK